jgi:hypothetical protein
MELAKIIKKEPILKSIIIKCPYCFSHHRHPEHHIFQIKRSHCFFIIEPKYYKIES